MAEMKRFELLRRFEADLPHFEGRETDKTPYISAQVRIKYVRGIYILSIPRNFPV